LSGEIQFLLDCQTQRDEAYENILRLNGDEIYADLGAFNGDTVFEFLSHVKSCRKIYAFEPDVKNYSKLVKNTKSVPNIQCFNLCVSDSRGEIRFSSDGGRNGSENKTGVAVPCNSLDGVLNGSGCTFIKFDVEGFEAPAIKGAAETIKKYKPKMLISCYHRSEDIFRIPLLVREIRDDYKISIRHYPYIPAWDTQFYFT
ncbi:MAG: FkbM family methyltransferase, partial [Clostridiales bacterium]|nr:FkbM family methyltransferase [Clostridiales bacterium]